MPRRLTPAQIRSQFRQAKQKRRQAINKYNADVKRAVDNYNREARAHNARVRSNRRRLEREIRQLSTRATSTTYYIRYRQSVFSLRESFDHLESGAESGTWTGGDDLLDLSVGETANSVAVLNALLAQPDQMQVDDHEALQQTSITDELSEISGDLDARWHGALYALSPRNPDAARHFCTSSREILTAILESAAPEDAVIHADPRADRTGDGRVTRRARIRYCLHRKGMLNDDLAAFVDDDLDNVITLFREFNDATHGSAGRFALPQLVAIKTRVEDAIRFLHRIVR